MITDVNPFVYSRPISPEEIVDRDDETEQLLKNAVGGHYVRLYAPRKYGKTSLLRRALADGAKREGLVPVLVDLYGVVSLADVAVRFERAYAKELRGRSAVAWRSSSRRPASGSRSARSGSARGSSSSRRPTRCPRCTRSSTCRSGWRRRAGSGRSSRWTSSRTSARCPPWTGSCAATSSSGRRRLVRLRRLGARPDEAALRAEGGTAVRIRGSVRLGRLRDEDIAAYVADRFRQSKRNVGEALNPLLASAKGHPQRAMLLAHRLWEEVERGGTATLDDWASAHEAALDELQPEFEAQWRGLDTSEQKTMRAILAGEGSPYRAAVLERLGLTKTMAQKALQRLGARAEVEVGGPQAGGRRPPLRGVDRAPERAALLVDERPLQPAERLALNARKSLRVRVVRERGPDRDREHPRAEQLLLLDRAVGVEERRSSLRRHEPPEERKVDRRVGRGRDRPSRSPRSPAGLRRARDGSAGRRGRRPAALSEGGARRSSRMRPRSRRRAPDAEPLERGELLARQRHAHRHVGARAFASSGSGSSRSRACSARRKRGQLSATSRRASSSSSASHVSTAR